MQIQLSLPLLLKPWTVNAMPTLKEECSEGALLSVFMVVRSIFLNVININHEPC